MTMLTMNDSIGRMIVKTLLGLATLGAVAATRAQAAEPAQVEYTIPLETQSAELAVPADTYGTLALLRVHGLSATTLTLKHIAPYKGGTATNEIATAVANNADKHYPAGPVYTNGVVAVPPVLLARGDRLLATLSATNSAPVRVVLRVRRD